MKKTDEQITNEQITSEWKKATSFVKGLINTEEVVCAICSKPITEAQVDDAKGLMYTKNIHTRTEQEVVLIHRECQAECEDPLLLFDDPSVKIYRYTPVHPYKPFYPGIT